MARLRAGRVPHARHRRRPARARRHHPRGRPAHRARARRVRAARRSARRRRGGDAERRRREQRRRRRTTPTARGARDTTLADVVAWLVIQLDAQRAGPVEHALHPERRERLPQERVRCAPPARAHVPRGARARGRRRGGRCRRRRRRRGRRRWNDAARADAAEAEWEAIVAAESAKTEETRTASPTRTPRTSSRRAARGRRRGAARAARGRRRDRRGRARGRGRRRRRRDALPARVRGADRLWARGRPCPTRSRSSRLRDLLAARVDLVRARGARRGPLGAARGRALRAARGRGRPRRLDTEQEREQEQEQQKEVRARRDQQVEVEKFVEREYSRNEEKPSPWPLASLARRAAAADELADGDDGDHPFYPLAAFRLRHHEPLAFPRALLCSRNYYRRSWGGLRRCKNVVVVLEWAPDAHAGERLRTRAEHERDAGALDDAQRAALAKARTRCSRRTARERRRRRRAARARALGAAAIGVITDAAEVDDALVARVLSEFGDGGGGGGARRRRRGRGEPRGLRGAARVGRAARRARGASSSRSRSPRPRRSRPRAPRARRACRASPRAAASRGASSSRCATRRCPRRARRPRATAA